MRIGVISDTHGLLRPEALAALRGCDVIIHAGDVGKPGIMERLAEIAPVFAVRGNVDKGEWARALPMTRVVEVDVHFLYVVHDLHDLDLDPAAAGFHAVISGHSHIASIQRTNDVLYLNPGAAGPKRFHLPVSIAIIELYDGILNPRIIQLREGE